jgi:HPt (histidine-containing phosphotransfer) domain-containing protein
VIATVDPGALERLIQAGGTELLVGMVDLFLQNTPIRLDAMRSGIEQRDWSSIERAAHSMKSSAAYLGLFDLRDRAERIEALAAEGADAQLVARIDELLRAFPGIREALTCASGRIVFL